MEQPIKIAFETVNENADLRKGKFDEMIDIIKSLKENKNYNSAIVFVVVENKRGECAQGTFLVESPSLNFLNESHDIFDHSINDTAQDILNIEKHNDGN